ncbi:hypothetical protein CCAX7_56010 [Capsulimonas corticalis]|uniref:Uncharacterized protein n=1 Tax=Capsulimonas corticalis TaxID=2219043 RepID=A0A402D0M1_9BACT|nr:glycoside hydrolase family 76 protein [Capsulimonas corticalis]BDI33550.1 hypothetical protein CCAX7_56010 [Capsulimonas corticalis]
MFQNKLKFSLKGIAVQTGLVALLVGACCALPQQASAIGSGDADTMFNGFNNAFLVNGNYYKTSINGNTFDGGWTGAIDIMVAEDAYERTGSSAHKALVEALCTTFLQKFPPGYTWDGYNDDEGWIGTMLARGYLITGDSNLLLQARTACVDMVWSRGWDTQYNGGGIWEQQPNMTPAGQTIDKEALSNDSIGKAACLIYMGNHDQWYLDRATQIYAWVRSHLFNTSNGQVYNGVDRSGNVNTGRNVYNQGTFADYANYLYQITGNVQYYNDAKLALDYVKGSTWYNGGVMTGGGTNTWSDEYARGLGHFCRDNRMWGTYLSWAQANANAAMSHRRTDYNICWSDFTTQTPNDNSIITNRFCDAAAWLQYTPVTQPNNIWGRHTIVGLNNMAIDSLGLTATNSVVGLWGLNYGQTQIWNFTQNADTSWNIVSQSSWLGLDDPGGNTTNGTKMIQWTQSRDSNQRWWVDVQSDGTYKIWNQASSLALDSSSTTTNGQALIGWGWSGQPQQRWKLQ